MKAGLRVSIQAIRLWCREAKKSEHILRVKELLAGHAGGHKFS
jgi:hypothetical protein